MTDEIGFSSRNCPSTIDGGESTIVEPKSPALFGELKWTNGTAGGGSLFDIAGKRSNNGYKPNGLIIRGTRNNQVNNWFAVITSNTQ